MIVASASASGKQIIKNLGSPEIEGLPLTSECTKWGGLRSAPSPKLLVPVYPPVSVTSAESVKRDGPFTAGLSYDVLPTGSVLTRPRLGREFSPQYGSTLDRGIGGGPDITIHFSTPVMGAGAQIQSDVYGDLVAQVTDTNGNTHTDTYTEPGVSNGQGGWLIYLRPAVPRDPRSGRGQAFCGLQSL